MQILALVWNVLDRPPMYRFPGIAPYLIVSLLSVTPFVIACGGGGSADGGIDAGDVDADADGTDASTTDDGGDESPPSVIETTPSSGSSGVVLNAIVTATFDESIDPGTIHVGSFRLAQGTTPVAAGVTLSGTVATLDPTADLMPDTAYTATVTTDVTDLAGNAMEADETWTFTTGTNVANGPAPVPLGTAGHFAVLSKAGVDTVPTSLVTGDVGVSPIDSTALTGFSLVLDAGGAFATSTQIVGKAYAPDYVAPTAAMLTAAVSNMEAAYTDAAGRTAPDFVELGGGEIGGLTLVPGLYKWGTGVLVGTDVTLDGGPDDVWIFQISGGITQAAAVQVILTGGASPSNVFWQAAGAVALDTTAHLEGVVLSQSEVTLATGASIQGRILSQTAVTLDASTVTQPGD